MKRLLALLPWMLVNLVAGLPLVAVLAMCELDLSGDGPIVAVEMPQQRRSPRGPDGQEITPLWFPIHSTGEWSLRWLVVSLTLTPLAVLLGWRRAPRYRKLFGLYALAYTVAHLVFFVIERGLAATVSEINFVVGLVATALMLALGLTSSARAQLWLGRRWRQLHRAAYVSGILAVLHVVLLGVGSWQLYAGVLGIGFVLRIPLVRNAVTSSRLRLFRRAPAPA